MNGSPHRLILASAGTGKTWQLTGRYLELLFEGVQPERILATTFTRKAAGEILDRLLRRLVEATEDTKQRSELSKQVGRELAIAEIRSCLAALTHRFDRFRVRTLDAFFVHMARLFALDLGLPPDWSIVEEAEDEALRRDAVARALADSDRLELLELLRGLQQGAASRSVERILLQKVGDGRNAFLDSRPEAWKRIQAPESLGEEELARTLATLESLAIPTTKSGTLRKHWQKAYESLLRESREGNWRALLGIGLVKKILLDEDNFDSVKIDAKWRATIDALLRQSAHVLIGEVSRENGAALRWLERFEKAYEELKGTERAYRFEDLPKALHPRDESRIAAQELIWYRMDARIDHLLLDEFQDTAPIQWRILEQLAGEILADGSAERSFFCVGDVKQSIYGWREAEPRLLAGMSKRYPVLEPEHLSENFRSSAVVLDTVTRVFADIASNPVFAEREERVRGANEFQASFELPREHKPLPGAAFLIEAAQDPDDRNRERVLQLAADRAYAILDEAPAATIGLLLRRNNEIPLLIHLLRDRGLRASGEGGNPLTDSAAVLHFVSLLHLADHPGDTAAAFHVATAPIAPLVGFTPESFREQRAEVSAVVRKRLANEGYGAYCASFVELVACEYGAWDRKRFDQLVDLAHSFEDRAGLRADLFVDHVRLTPVEDPSATQVKVMTIHAAKGLEFDAVILPELDTKLSLRETPLLTQRSDPAGLIETVSHSRSREVCNLDQRQDGLAVLRAEQQQRETGEALCLLYVAMTRARHRLDMIIGHRNKPQNVSKSFAGLLCAGLAPGKAQQGGIVWAHEDNAGRWFPERLAGDSATASSAPASERIPPRFPARTESRKLVTRTPSAEEGDGKQDPVQLLRSPRSEARLRGMLVHRWLEEVEWIEDFQRSDEELLALGRSIAPDHQLRRSALEDFRAALVRPRLRAVLSHPGQGAELEVWRERSFAVVLPGEEEDELWSGVFDRVVLQREEGQLSRAELIDYKTDRLERDEVATRTDFYRPQVQGYRRVLAHMTGLAEEAIEGTLAFLHPDTIQHV